MTTLSVTAGADAFASALALLAERTADLGEPDTAAADLVAVEARGRAPRRTGRLAASVQSGPQGVSVEAPYAIPVHFGTVYMAARPFVLEAVEAQAQEVVDVYAAAIAAHLNKIG